MKRNNTVAGLSLFMLLSGECIEWAMLSESAVKKSKQRVCSERKADVPGEQKSGKHKKKKI